MPTVLVVEDDNDIRTELADALAAAGYPTVAVEAGDQAIEYLRDNEPPRMVLLDMGLPRVTGEEFLRWFCQQDGLRQSTKVAVLSAWVPEDHDIEEYKHCIVAILQKPYGIEQVLVVLEQHCGPPRAARA
jgi:DNA-binding response OmpR family regulator